MMCTVIYLVMFCRTQECLNDVHQDPLSDYPGFDLGDRSTFLEGNKHFEVRETRIKCLGSLGSLGGGDLGAEKDKKSQEFPRLINQDVCKTQSVESSPGLEIGNRTRTHCQR